MEFTALTFILVYCRTVKYDFCIGSCGKCLKSVAYLQYRYIHFTKMAAYRKRTNQARAMPWSTPIARFMGPKWGSSGADRTQVAPCWTHESCYLGNIQSLHFTLNEKKKHPKTQDRIVWFNMLWNWDRSYMNLVKKWLPYGPISIES